MTNGTCPVARDVSKAGIRHALNICSMPGAAKHSWAKLKKFDKEALLANGSSPLCELVSISRWTVDQVLPAQPLESPRNRIILIQHG